MAVKILVVDDEPDMEILIKQKFRRQVREGQFEFLFAANGLEALETLAGEPGIDMVLSDINMPEMDGLTLLSKLADLDQLIKAVIITAYGDMENIRVAMNRGAFDFLTKPIDFKDLEITIKKTLKLMEQLRRAVDEHQQLQTIQREMEIARNLQQSILPRKFTGFPGDARVDLHAMMIPARQVGGDFYDFFHIDDHHLGVVIADVCGKGFPAALFMMMSRTMIRTNAMAGMGPHECLFTVNNLLCADNPEDMFVTVFYGLINSKTGEMQYSNGGHNPPLIMDAAKNIRMLEHGDGMALGVFPGAPYLLRQTRLAKGDTLVLYTDGVTEAENAGEEFFGNHRLHAALKEATAPDAAFMIAALLDAIRRFTGDMAQADDITALVLRFLSEPFHG